MNYCVCACVCVCVCGCVCEREREREGEGEENTCKFTIVPNRSKYPLNFVIVFKSRGTFLNTIVSLGRDGCLTPPIPPKLLTDGLYKIYNNT